MTEFRTDISENGKKFELVFQTDIKAYFEKMQATARECIDHKPVTQFDRIKAKIANMTVDEISEFLSKSRFCENFCAFTENGICNSHGSPRTVCNKGIKQWLESEVSE